MTRRSPRHPGQTAALLPLLLVTSCGPWAGPGTPGASRTPEPRYERVDAQATLRTASQNLLACHGRMRTQAAFAPFAARTPLLGQPASAGQLADRTRLGASQHALFLQFTQALYACARDPLDSILRPVLHRTALRINEVVNDFNERQEGMVYRDLSWGALNQREASFAKPIRAALSELDESDRQRNADP